MKKNMKIVYVNPMSRNAPEIYDRNLLENIKNLDIAYFCSKTIKNDDFKEIKLIKNYNYDNRSIFIKGVSYISSQLKLLRYLVLNEIDIVHFQWLRLYSFDYLIIKCIKKLTNSRVILTAHNILPHDTGNKYYGIHKKIYKIVDRIIAHDINTKLEIIEKFEVKEEKIRVVPHGLIEAVVEKSKIMTNKIQKKKITFGLFGSLQEYKGVDILLEAWNNDEELLENKDIQLIIAGKLKMKLNYKSNKNVYIYDKFLTDEEIIEILNKVDVFILPYRKISQSGALLSILKSRKPVIVSKVGGLTQPFILGKIGWILKENTSKYLNECIREVIKKEYEITEIKENKELWDKIEEYYSWDKIAKLTKEIYEEKS